MGLSTALNESINRTATVVRIADDFVSRASAQKFVHRNIECFSFDVPKCDIYGTYCGGLDDPAGEEATAEHHLPQMFDLERVCTNEKRFKRANDFG